MASRRMLVEELDIIDSMHEFSLLSGVVSTVTAHASGRTVEKVALRVGSRAGVVTEALHAAWPLARSGTCCAAARLEVEDITATVYCPSCAKEVEIDEYFALTCPRCGTPTADLRRGREFEIAYIDLADT